MVLLKNYLFNVNSDNLTGLINLVPILKFCFNIAPPLFISMTV